MPSSSNSFNDLVLEHWDRLERRLRNRSDPVLVDGQTLDIASVVAVARYSKLATIDESTLKEVVKSAEAVQGRLSKGEVIYGINTGFGGSADTRNSRVDEVQQNLLRSLHYGIISDGLSTLSASPSSPRDLAHVLQQALPLEDPAASTSMPESWVRAAMIIRLGSLVKGASGVRPTILETLSQLLDRDLVPRIPLRGSISASGDLSPLSYIAGAMQGKPAIQVYAGYRHLGQRRVMRADKALKEAGMQPVNLRAKEGLAIVNGTAVSAAVASLALHDAMLQATMAQILTAMTVEALAGTTESFDPFIAETRPHRGQIDSAKNILGFLSGSKLAYHNDGTEEGSLRQDRYSIRTASQWIGPVLEDLTLAHEQIAIEINSVTDNPIVNREGRMLHGGNFQARVVTSAMEKTRQACQSIGRMLFAQCNEMINPATNRGLPPNLVVDEPSESWLWKGTDLFIAALQSELGFLANPAGTHVQTAEMGNQALNSLALISARYTVTSLDVLTQLASTHLVAACQALDLRALHLDFLTALAPDFAALTRDAFADVLAPTAPDLDTFVTALWTAFKERILRVATMDSAARFASVLEAMQGLALRSLAADAPGALDHLRRWQASCADAAASTYRRVRAAYLAAPDPTPLLGPASRRLYRFVRHDLRVPFLGNDLLQKAEWEEEVSDSDADGSDGAAWEARERHHSTGEMITSVYEACKSGRLYEVVVACLRDAGEAGAVPDSPELAKEANRTVDSLGVTKDASGVVDSLRDPPEVHGAVESPVEERQVNAVADAGEGTTEVNGVGGATQANGMSAGEVLKGANGSLAL